MEMTAAVTSNVVSPNCGFGAGCDLQCQKQTTTLTLRASNVMLAGTIPLNLQHQCSNANLTPCLTLTLRLCAL